MTAGLSACRSAARTPNRNTSRLFGGCCVSWLPQPRSDVPAMPRSGNGRARHLETDRERSMNRPIRRPTATIFTGMLLWGVAALAQAQQGPAQTPPPAMPSPPDVKIETTELAPGIYML